MNIDRRKRSQINNSPCLLIALKGKKISDEHTIDFINRTDRFWFDPEIESEQCDFVDWYQELSGYSRLMNLDKDSFEKVLSLISREMNYVKLSSLFTNFAYIKDKRQVQGIVKPDGSVFMLNIIKGEMLFDSVIYDILKIANRFPYLDFSISLSTGSNIVDFNPVYTGVSFKVGKGQIEFAEEEICKYDEPELINMNHEFYNSIVDSEVFLPDEWYIRQANQCKKILESINLSLALKHNI